MSAPELVRTLVGVGLLSAVALAVLWIVGAPRRFAPLLAVLRGTAQLVVLSLILSGVIRDLRWVAVALLVMFAVAAGTAIGRLGWSRHHAAAVAGGMAAGILVTMTVVFSTGAIGFSARYALAVGGIVIGNAMTIATLSGRRLTELIHDHWEVVEGWLALGARPREATRDLARRAIQAALIPTVDQTRTTGIVTLPGAFVGAIFGGVSPLEAGRFQIVVLASIISAGAITAAVIVAALAPATVRPAVPA